MPDPLAEQGVERTIQLVLWPVVSGDQEGVLYPGKHI